MCLEQHLEDQDYELNSRYDYVRETYYATAAGLADYDLEAEEPSDGLIAAPDLLFRFVTGGNATFTIVSNKTGKRYTFRARVAKDNPRMFFVSTLVGSDNTSDFAYLGFFKTMCGTATGGRERFMLDTRTRGVLLAGKKGDATDVRFRGLNYVLTTVAQDRFPDDVTIYHEGKCCRCGRKLTTPESVASGIGPECAKKGA